MIMAGETFLGLELKNPFIAASCPATGSLDGARQLEEAGAGAIVMRSIFEEEIRQEIESIYDEIGMNAPSAAQDYLRAELPFRLGSDRYIDLVREMKRELSIPVIASVNCTTADKWILFAKKLEKAGADAVELNIYDIPLDVTEDALAIEKRRLHLISSVASDISIPVSVKLSPYYSSLLNFARKAQDAGAKGLVFFNRFLQPDINTESMGLIEKVHFSTPADLRLPLRWIAISRDLLGCDLALSGGVHSGDDAVKAILAGADVVYICSALYSKRGFAALGDIASETAAWMQRHGFSSFADFRGRMREQNLSDGHGFERAHYMHILGNA